VAIVSAYTNLADYDGRVSLPRLFSQEELPNVLLIAVGVVLRGCFEYLFECWRGIGVTASFTGLLNGCLRVMVICLYASYLSDDSNMIVLRVEEYSCGQLEISALTRR
jgi:hypothetical protein